MHSGFLLNSSNYLCDMFALPPSPSVSMGSLLHISSHLGAYIRMIHCHPYFSIYVSQCFHHGFNQKSIRTDGRQTFFKPSGTNISHMTFVDDIVLFGEASLPNIHSMLSVMDSFYYAFGQDINFSKSQVIYGSSVDYGVL